MAYAQGKKSKARCDRCGFVYYYLQLKKDICRAPATEAPPTTGYGIIRTGNTKNALGESAPSMDVNHNDPIGTSFDLQNLEASLGDVTIVT